MLKRSLFLRDSVRLVIMLLSLAAGERARAEEDAYLLHLPGIAGEMPVDHDLIRGLRQGGVRGECDIYDWTGEHQGIPALLAHDRHRREAAAIAQRLLERRRSHSGQPIYLTCHSGGAGLAVWALELLPADVQIDTLLMLAPALSPAYDLSAALQRVRGRAFVFSSPWDAMILGGGTRLFGTIDGVHSEAAGLVGFVRPPGADPVQYMKLAPRPYESRWLRQYGNGGDHVGTLDARFARGYLAPLLRGGNNERPENKAP